MSHYALTVLLSPDAVPENVPLDTSEGKTALMEALTTALARYDENRPVAPYHDEEGDVITHNPEGRWDWWIVGGRWRGRFLPKKTAPRNELIHGRPGVFDNAPNPFVDESGNVRVKVDGGRLRDLDLAAMREQAAKKAATDYDAYQAAVAGTEELIPWSHFRDRAVGAIAAMPKGRVETIHDAVNVVNAKYGAPLDATFDELEAMARAATRERVENANANTPAVPGSNAPDPTVEKDREWWWAERAAERKRIEATHPTFGAERAAERKRIEATHPTFGAEREQAQREAAQKWDAALTYDYDRAHADYHDQPRVKALRAHPNFGEGAGWILDNPEDWFEGHSREQYIQLQVNEAVPGYATITPDGEWAARGEMRWFGMSDDTAVSRELYAERVNKIIDEQPDDTILVLVDCHT